MKPRHKYIVVFGSCCTADALRARNLEDIRGANLRLLWYQGRSSFLSLVTDPLEPHEFTYRNEREGEKGVNWNLTMAADEAKKRQRERLLEVIGMSDALVIDVVSAFSFPYLVVDPAERCFLQSEDWSRYIALRSSFERRRLWDFPMERSFGALRRVLEPLYEQQRDLRVIFHLPRPCFNDGVTFEDSELTENVSYYDEFGRRLHDEAARSFPGVALVACGGERADPEHENGPSPFHYDERYMGALRMELERLLE